MVLASGLLLALFALQLTALHAFLVLSLMNAAAALYVYHLLPEFLLRFVCWILTNCIYRLHTVGRDNIPAAASGRRVSSCITASSRHLSSAGFFATPR